MMHVKDFHCELHKTPTLRAYNSIVKETVPKRVLYEQGLYRVSTMFLCSSSAQV